MPPANQAALKGLQEQTGEEVSVVMSLRQDRKLGGSENSLAGYTKRPQAVKILVKGQRGS